jgi:hypothetical protein
VSITFQRIQIDLRYLRLSAKLLFPLSIYLLSSFYLVQAILCVFWFNTLHVTDSFIILKKIIILLLQSISLMNTTKSKNSDSDLS